VADVLLSNSLPMSSSSSAANPKDNRQRDSDVNFVQVHGYVYKKFCYKHFCFYKRITDYLYLVALQMPMRAMSASPERFVSSASRTINTSVASFAEQLFI
jgi:hypothetical protein